MYLVRSLGHGGNRTNTYCYISRKKSFSLSVFHKIHISAVSIDKYKYFTPAAELKQTRTSHNLKYTQYLVLQ